MKNVKVKINLVGKNPIPKYSHEGDACFDLQADFTNGYNSEIGEGHAWDDIRKVLILFSGGRVVIPTGIKTQFPEEYMLKIQDRSGLAAKSGIHTMAGVVDSNYSAEIGVVLYNTSSDFFEIKQGDRIAQACLVPTPKVEFVEEKFTDTERGTNGFGSTGI